MQKRTFGKTGLSVSPLGFGAAPIGYLEVQRQQSAHVLNTLLDSGINVIDTAASYLDAEIVIGETVADRRSEFVLVSKCGGAVPHVSGEAWSAQLITDTVDASLKRLRTDVIDVMLLHSCKREVLERGEALGALVKAREAGKIRFAGYSGDNEAALYAATLEDVSVLETSINICDQHNLAEVLPIARERDLGVIVKRPIANAAWKQRDQQPGIYANYAATYTKRLQQMDITPADLGFDGEPAVLWPQIALRFTLSQPGAHTAIIGTTNPEHLQANIKAVEQGPLPGDVVRKLREAFDRGQERDGKPWLGQT